VNAQVVGLEGRVFSLSPKMRTRTLQASPSEAMNFLHYLVNYYPSGTKQEPGSRLDRMVESARASAVREITAYLREHTGETLGNGPTNRIQKYGSK
jgi:hypothetical protein